ncbi:MAG: hypothetical protein OEY14_04130 [Myxococcales bacterium]|nr:hypothetical protein [Myxococcales bacterium]
MTRMARWLEDPRARAWALLLGVALSLPALWVGPVHDDFGHRLLLEGALPIERGPWELYDFLRESEGLRLREAGAMPWFADSEVRVRFLRPVSSLTLALDHALFGRLAWPAHLHSLAWFALLASLAAWILGRLLPPPRAALATLLFVTAGAHAVPLSWLAARHALVAAALGLGALAAHLRWRSGGGLRWATLSTLLLIASLLSGEVGLCALVMIALRAGLEPERRGRIVAASPALSLGAVYVAAYALLGYGPKGSGAYASPIEEPLAFGWRILHQAPILLGELFAAAPAAPAAISPLAARALVVVGCLSSAVILGLLLRAARSKGGAPRGVLLWLSASLLVSVALVSPGIVGGRGLLIALLASSVLLVEAIYAARAEGTGWLASSRRAIGALLLFAHLLMAPLVRLSVELMYIRFSELEQELAERAELELPADASVYVLNGSDPAIGLYAGPAILFHRPEALHQAYAWRVLSVAPRPLRILRSGERELELEILPDPDDSDRNPAPRIPTMLEEVFRSPARAMRVAERVEFRDMQAQILRVEAGFPARTRFVFAHPLEDARVWLLVWRDGQLRRLMPPALGETQLLPFERGPHGL